MSILPHAECKLAVLPDPQRPGQSVLWSSISGESVPLPGIFVLKFSTSGWGYLQGPGGPQWVKQFMQNTLYQNQDGRVYAGTPSGPKWVDELCKTHIA
eukprot:7962290-Lingulodinium_polyedra.AAC.1